jgi:hypothetical protein
MATRPTSSSRPWWPAQRLKSEGFPVSLIIAWDHPEQTYEQRIHNVQVWRNGINTGCLLAGDATWGIFEDETESDLNAEIDIAYVDDVGSIIAQIPSPQVRRYLRPSDTCKICFQLRDFDGGPDDARIIQFSSPNNQTYTRRILTSSQGKAFYLGLWGARTKVYIDGYRYALDCVIPKVKEITWPKLSEYGSWVQNDLRGIM